MSSFQICGLKIKVHYLDEPAGVVTDIVSAIAERNLWWDTARKLRNN